MINPELVLLIFLFLPYTSYRNQAVQSTHAILGCLLGDLLNQGSILSECLLSNVPALHGKLSSLGQVSVSIVVLLGILLEILSCGRPCLRLSLSLISSGLSSLRKALTKISSAFDYSQEISLMLNDLNLRRLLSHTDALAEPFLHLANGLEIGCEILQNFLLDGILLASIACALASFTIDTLKLIEAFGLEVGIIELLEHTHRPRLHLTLSVRRSDLVDALLIQLQPLLRHIEECQEVRSDLNSQSLEELCQLLEEVNNALLNTGQGCFGENLQTLIVSHRIQSGLDDHCRCTCGELVDINYALVQLFADRGAHIFGECAFQNSTLILFVTARERTHADTGLNERLYMFNINHLCFTPSLQIEIEAVEAYRLSGSPCCGGLFLLRLSISSAFSSFGSFGTNIFTYDYRTHDTLALHNSLLIALNNSADNLVGLASNKVEQGRICLCVCSNICVVLLVCSRICLSKIVVCRLHTHLIRILNRLNRSCLNKNRTDFASVRLRILLSHGFASNKIFKLLIASAESLVDLIANSRTIDLHLRGKFLCLFRRHLIDIFYIRNERLDSLVYVFKGSVNNLIKLAKREYLQLNSLGRLVKLLDVLVVERLAILGMHCNPGSKLSQQILKEICNLLEYALDALPDGLLCTRSGRIRGAARIARLRSTLAVTGAILFINSRHGALQDRGIAILHGHYSSLEQALVTSLFTLIISDSLLRQIVIECVCAFREAHTRHGIDSRTTGKANITRAELCEFRKRNHN
nr:MAG TPA: hypothetical protein [Caudoviricetes sp.]